MQSEKEEGDEGEGMQGEGGEEHTAHVLQCVGYSTVRKSAEHHTLGGEATRPATEPELMTYALMQSFSHMSYEITHTPSSPIPFTYVPE